MVEVGPIPRQILKTLTPDADLAGIFDRAGRVLRLFGYHSSSQGGSKSPLRVGAISYSSRNIRYTRDVTWNRRHGRNPNIGFGMVPPRKQMEHNYVQSVKVVYNALWNSSYGKEILDAVSVVKGLINRVLREDQPDWVWSWYQLGLPRRPRLRRIVSGLVTLRKAVLNSDFDTAATAATKLERAGLLSFLGYFIDRQPVSLSKDTGLLYILSTREDRTLLKIGQTRRNIFQRVPEINQATGVVNPYSARRLWRVADPAPTEARVHKLLADYRVRTDREFFRIEIRDAESLIEPYLYNTNSISRHTGSIRSLAMRHNYGFVSSDNSRAYLLHERELWDVLFADLRVGDEMSFDRVETRSGLLAADARVSTRA